MLKPLPARLLRYALYLLALLLIGITILLWQAPTLIQRHLPGWLATHYGLHLSLGKIEVGIRSPSLVLGPSALLDDQQQALVSFEELKLIPALKASWQQRALVLEEATLTAPRADLVRLEDLKGEARFNLTDALASLLAPAPVRLFRYVVKIPRQKPAQIAPVADPPQGVSAPPPANASRCERWAIPQGRV